MTNRRSHVAALLSAGCLAGCLGLAGLAGCASSGGASGGGSKDKLMSDGSIDLDGTKWKQRLVGGTFDGKEIQFSREKGVFMGKVTTIGRLWRNNTAVHEGTWIYQLFLPPAGKNTYRGIFRPPGGMEGEATFSVSEDGQLLRCSMSDDNWFRQD